MSKTRSPSMRGIYSQYKTTKLAEEMRGSWAIAVLYRSPSIVLTWAFVRLGVSAMLITFIGILATLAMPIVAAVLPLHQAAITVVFLAVLFQILDCCDGDVARLSGTVTAFGGRADLLSDIAQWALLYVSIGILADRYHEAHWAYTSLAMLAAWVRLYARVINKYNPKIKKTSTPAPMKPASYPVAFVAGLSGVIPFLALSGPYIGIAVFAILAYSLIDLVDAIRAILKSRNI